MSGWTPQCPEPGALADLAAHGIRTERDGATALHVRGCPYCLRVYARTRDLFGPAAAGTQRSEARARRAWGAGGFTVGAAAAAAVLLFALYLPRQAREAKLRQQTADARAALEGTQKALSEARGRIARLQQRPAQPVVVADASLAAALDRAVLLRRLEVPDLAGEFSEMTRSAQGAPRAEAALSRPVMTVVLSDRPVLRARAPNDGTRLAAWLTDAGGGEVALVAVGRGAWKPAPRLRRGARYLWSVDAGEGDDARRSIVAGFRVLSADGLREVSRVARAHADSPLALAVLYARAGLLDDAQEALGQAARRRPDDPVIAALRADLRRARTVFARGSPPP